MIDFTVVTVCNKYPIEPYYCLDAFIKSIRDEVPVVLGTKPGEYGGLGSKPRLLHQAITNKTINTKHIIFCDCFDLVFAVHPKELFGQYLLFNSPFVISAEKNCFPADLKDEYDKLDSGGSPYKYLNSGMIVAETDAMLAVLDAMDAPNIPNDYYSPEIGGMINPNDQEYYQHQFLKQPVPMVLDYAQQLCNTLHSVELDELDFTEPRIMNKITCSLPCAFHLNGSAKTDGLREPILKHLQLI